MPSDNKPTNDSPESSPPLKAGKIYTQSTMGFELALVLVGAVLLGGAAGFYLDRWLHTSPLLTFLFGAMGFYGGIRDVIRRSSGKRNGSSAS